MMPNMTKEELKKAREKETADRLYTKHIKLAGQILKENPNINIRRNVYFSVGVNEALLGGRIKQKRHTNLNEEQIEVLEDKDWLNLFKQTVKAKGGLSHFCKTNNFKLNTLKNLYYGIRWCRIDMFKEICRLLDLPTYGIEGL